MLLDGKDGDVFHLAHGNQLAESSGVKTIAHIERCDQRLGMLAELARQALFLFLPLSILLFLLKEYVFLGVERWARAKDASPLD